jgi:hypothetical protein
LYNRDLSLHSRIFNIYLDVKWQWASSSIFNWHLTQKEQQHPFQTWTVRWDSMILWLQNYTFQYWHPDIFIFHFECQMLYYHLEFVYFPCQNLLLQNQIYPISSSLLTMYILLHRYINLNSILVFFLIQNLNLLIFLIP